MEKSACEYWPNRTTGDDDTIDALLFNGDVVPTAPSSDDLRWAADWIATYATDPDSDGEIARAFANALVFLLRKADEMDGRKRTNAAKRAYAEAHGIPFGKVRVKR